PGLSDSAAPTYLHLACILTAAKLTCCCTHGPAPGLHPGHYHTCLLPHPRSCTCTRPASWSLHTCLLPHPRS
ncbi:unnamed protein product, partial [Staurois parvus]